MKRNVTIALVAFLMLTGASTVCSQETTTPTEKKSFGTWLTKTPWTVGFGGDIVHDHATVKLVDGLLKYDYYPAKFTADKDLKKGWSAQFAFASTSLNPHNFMAIDLNAKYKLMKTAKMFDPYALLGLGYTYRDLTPFVSNDKDNSSANDVNFNIGAGFNIWMFPNMAFNAQGLLKAGTNSYLVGSLGLVFKIGNAKEECTATPKTKEAEDALQHLRGIISK